jgi:hypothetical protein
MMQTRSRSMRRRRANAHLMSVVVLAGGCADPSTVVGTQRIGGSVALAQAPSTAEVFAPGVISDANEQWRITFTPDGRTAYFASSAGFFPITRQATIYETRLANGEWSTPTVASFSGTYSDMDPFIAPNGQRLYFSSIRPVAGVARGDIDLWMVERTPDGWGEPVRLGPEVNSPNDELYPSASAAGTLYFASGPLFPQAGKHFDIYSAERAGDGFAPRVTLGAGVNTVPSPSDAGLQDAWEFNPEITVDGRTLLFTSLRPGGFGFGDIYVSHFVNGEWTAARNLGPRVNTAADEFHPTLTRNRQELFFVRRIPARGNFYHISTSVLDIF